MSRCVEQVYMCEKFLVAKNCTEDAGLTQCNLLLSVEAPDPVKMDQEMTATGGDCGVGASTNIMNFDALTALLTQLRNIGEPNYTLTTLAPLPEHIHKVISESLVKYISTAKSMPYSPPILALIKMLSPYGVIAADSVTRTPGMDRLRGPVVRRGRIQSLEGLALRLPVERIQHIHLVMSQSAWPIKLYLVIGPSDEIMCEEASDTTVRARTLDDNNIVHDQEYAAVFVFGDVSSTVESVCEEAISRCKKYTRNTAAETYKEMAVLHLGDVPSAMRPRIEYSGRERTAYFTDFTLKPDHHWYHTMFVYRSDRIEDEEVAALLHRYSQPPKVVTTQQPPKNVVTTEQRKSQQPALPALVPLQTPPPQRKKS